MSFTYDFKYNLAIELLADVVKLVVYSLPVLFLAARHLIGRRRRLLSFWGITRSQPQLNVYVSTLFVRKWGAVDFRGTVRSYAGPAISSQELSVTSEIPGLFSAPLLDQLPDRLRQWLGTRIHWSLQEIQPVLIASPSDRGKVGPGNALAIGSPGYNSAADLYTETCDPFLIFEQPEDKTVIRVARGPRKGDILDDDRGPYDETAIVQRLYYRETRSTIVMAAGHGVPGTVGAVRYIASRWERLAREFGDRPFAVCLRFPSAYAAPNALRNPVEIGRFGG